MVSVGIVKPYIRVRPPSRTGRDLLGSGAFMKHLLKG